MRYGFRRPSLAIIILFCVLFVAQITWAGSHGSGTKSVYVHGYTRKDGTYVQPYYRSAPGTGSYSPTVPNTPSAYVPNTSSKPAASFNTSAPVAAVPEAPGATVNVHGYYRHDGTYVKEYVRSAPGMADTTTAVAT